MQNGIILKMDFYEQILYKWIFANWNLDIILSKQKPVTRSL